MVVLMLRPLPSSITTYSAFFPASASTTGSVLACTAVPAANRRVELGHAVCRIVWVDVEEGVMIDHSFIHAFIHFGRWFGGASHAPLYCDDRRAGMKKAVTMAGRSRSRRAANPVLVAGRMMTAGSWGTYKGNA